MIVHHASPAPAQPEARAAEASRRSSCIELVLLGALVAARRPPADHRRRAVARRRASPLRRERWDTPDGDFVDVDFCGDADARGGCWCCSTAWKAARDSHYARAIAAHALAARLAPRDAAFPRLLGRAEPPAARLPLGRQRRRSTGSCDASRCPRTRHAVGVSLGGNALLKWLGERGADARALVRRAAAVSAPLDLAAAGDALDRGLEPLRLHAPFPRHAEAEVARQARALSRTCSTRRRCARARTFREFDDLVTAPLHGFRDTDDYWSARRQRAAGWSTSACRRWCSTRATTRSFRSRARSPRRERPRRSVVLEFPRTGGHAGFPGRRSAGSPRRLLDFLIRPVNRPRRNLSHLRHPRRRRPQPDARASCATSAARSARWAASAARRRSPWAATGGCPGPQLAAALADGLNAAGADVIDIGMAPTPIAYFAAHHLGTGSCVARDRQPQPARVQRPEDGGRAATRSRARRSRSCAGASRRGSSCRAAGKRTQRRRARCLRRAHRGRREARAAVPHRGRLRQRRRRHARAAPVPAARLRGDRALLRSRRQLSQPPSRPVAAGEPRRPRSTTLKSGEAELGLAFDGDGDRLGVVTKDGEIIFADRQLMLFAKDVLVAQSRRRDHLRREDARACSRPGSSATAASR